MSGIRIRFILSSFLAVGLAAWAARAANPVTVTGERVVPPSHVAERVTVRDVRTHEIVKAPDGSPLPYDPATLDFGSLTGTTSQPSAVRV